MSTTGWQNLVDETMDEKDAPSQYSVRIDENKRVHVEHLGCDNGYHRQWNGMPFPWFGTWWQRHYARKTIKQHIKRRHTPPKETVFTITIP